MSGSCWKAHFNIPSCGTSSRGPSRCISYLKKEKGKRNKTRGKPHDLRCVYSFIKKNLIPKGKMKPCGCFLLAVLNLNGCLARNPQQHAVKAKKTIWQNPYAYLSYGNSYGEVFVYIATPYFESPAPSNYSNPRYRAIQKPRSHQIARILHKHLKMLVP